MIGFVAVASDSLQIFFGGKLDFLLPCSVVHLKVAAVADK